MWELRGLFGGSQAGVRGGVLGGLNSLRSIDILIFEGIGSLCIFS